MHTKPSVNGKTRTRLSPRRGRLWGAMFTEGALKFPAGLADPNALHANFISKKI